MRRALLITAAVLLSLGAFAGTTPGLRAAEAAAERPDPVALAREVLSDSAYQQSLVPVEERSSLRTPKGSGDVLSTIAWILLWVGLTIALLVSGAAVVARLRERRARAEQILTDAAAADPAAALRPASLAEAERLAAAGAFTEAVRELLRVAVERLAAQREIGLPPSLTARELLRLLTPAGPLRAPFREIVATTELGVFGGRDLDAADWQRCRAACAQVLA